MRRGTFGRTITIAAALAVAVLLLLGAPLATAQTTPPDRPPVLVVAHRGDSAHAPEHTGAAYDRGVWAGADVIECDLQLTADDELVCVHDPNVDRTTGGTATGPVDSFTLAQLREMDFGTWFGPEFAGAKVVTLDEQLACYRAADPTLQFYIETKTQPDQGTAMETRLVEVLRENDMVPAGEPDTRSSPVIIQSFDAASLQTVRGLAPSLPTAQLLAATTPEIDAGQMPEVDVLAPSDEVLAAQPDLIARAHAAGLEVHTWTVDDPATIQSLVDQGIDGFFTNDPGVGRGVVDTAGLGTGRTPLEVGTPPPALSEVPSCPAGMGAGLRAATTTETITAEPDEVAGDATTSTSDDASNTVWIVLAVVAGVLVLAAVGFTLVRRRRS
jgi:glycerophosphoryl diester phosphodiesterase